MLLNSPFSSDNAFTITEVVTVNWEICDISVCLSNYHETKRSSHPEVFCEKVADLRPATLLKKRL